VNTSFYAGLIIAVSLIAANLPFVNERLFCIFRLRYLKKPFWIRLFEWIVWYGVVGVFAYFIEQHIGSVFSQKGMFFAITLCVFLVFGYVGFVFRYLRK
jgi:hypothetical protein